MDHFTNKRVITAGVITAIFTWGFDFLVHGHLLKDLYDANMRLFRPMAEMQEMMHWCIAFHLFMGILFAGGYAWWREHVTCGKVGSQNCPYRKSMGFGFWVGLLLAAPQLMVYMWMTIPIELPQAWALSELAKWTLAGALLAKVYDWQNSR